MAGTTGKRGWKIKPQFGRAPKLELAFERGGRIFAYLIPADERRQECFDAMKEIAEIFERKISKS